MKAGSCLIKNPKIFVGGALIFIIHFFRLKIDVVLQIDIDFDTDSNFLTQGTASFLPAVCTQNKPNP